MKKDDFIGLSFQEAYTAMRAGNKIRRHGSKGYWGFNKENAVEYIKLPYDGKEITYGKLSLTMKDCAANDWEIIPDEDGNIKVNPAEAVTVKKIFKDYPSYKSIRKVAQELRTDYAFVHDILHDARYTRMPIQIVPEVDIRRAYQVMQSNKKNPHTKKKIRRMY